MSKNKAGSFVNVRTYTESDYGITPVDENVNDIIARGDNRYYGWMCWAGIESLCIASDGTVYNATCRVEKLGNIYSDFELPSFPVECDKKWCACAADLNTSKVKDMKYIKLLRVGQDGN